MSAGSFDSSSSDGARRRIAHAGAGSSDLLRSLNYKKESMGKLLSIGPKNSTSQKGDLFPLFLKRQRVNSDSENERTKEKKYKACSSNSSVKTFCGQSFMSAVTSQKKDSHPAIHSDSDGDLGWMSKTKVANGELNKSGKLFIKTANLKTKAKRRAIMSSDEEWDKPDMDEESDFDDVPKRKINKSRRGNGVSKGSHKWVDEDFIITKKKNNRKHTVSTGSEDLDDEDSEEEIAETPSSSELSDGESGLNPKKSLKELTQNARRHREKQRRKGQAIADLSDASEEDGEMARGSDGEDFDSEDSDADERRDKRANRQRQILEDRCVEFVNIASVQEMIQTEKFNERLAKALVEKRPFRNYSHIKEGCGSIGRALQMLESYIEFLENRSILDQVLDDCKKQSDEIKAELLLLESGQSSINTQPSLLNSECVLHPYQQVGLQWLVMMNKLGLNAILADEMGLGKTIQIIAFLAWTKEQPNMQFPHLIVVPSSTLENWMNEIAKWCPSLRLLTYYGSIQDRAQLRHRASSRNVDVILTTYNMIISRPEDRSFFKKFRINYVIYDEGHMLRSCNTMRYKNLMRVQGKRKILLTGTPLQNNLVELISLLFFTMTKLFTKYCDDISMLLQMFARKGASLNSGKLGTSEKKSVGKRGRKAADEREEDVEPEEEEILENRPLYEQHTIAQAKRILHPFVLRRLKATVLNSLPKKSENVRMCEITPIQDELYGEVLRDYHESKVLGNGNAMGAMMQMRQVANHPLLYRRIYDNTKVREIARVLCTKEPKYKGKKAEYVAEDLSYMSDIQIHILCRKFSALSAFELETELALDSGKCKELDVLLPKIFDKGEKVLIFSQFTTLLDILELYMAHHNYKYCRLDGTTPVMERQDLINQFSEDASIKVFLLSTKAGGLGINLTAANNIIIHDIDLNPYNDKQAEDRCHRMGQTREVYVTRMIAQDTIEESMLELAQRKLELERHITAGHGKNQKEELDANTVDELLTRAIDRRRH